MAESPVTYDYNSTYKTMQATTHKKFKYGLYPAQIQTPQRHNQARKRYDECFYVVAVPTEDVHSGAANMQLKCRQYVAILSLLCLHTVSITTSHGFYAVFILPIYKPHNDHQWSLENHFVLVTY